MSIIISDLSYHYPNQNPLFEHLSFSVPNNRKVSVVGNNGSGKSTLLKLIAGTLQPVCGTISANKPYYVPQQTGDIDKTIAEVLEVADKLTALHAIVNGSVSQSDYDLLADDWEVEARCEAALDYWKLACLKLTTPMNELSGGEKTKVFLAGLLIRKPEIILLDEPTNHLDLSSRELLYHYIRKSKATIVTVSHDVTLLNLLDTTYELSSKRIKLYGGNYSFYQEQKAIEVNALNESIQAGEKHLRLAKKKAQEVKQRQERRANQGEKDKMQVVPILRKTMLNRGENTGARLNEKHAQIIQEDQDLLNDLRQQQAVSATLKIDFDGSKLHDGKRLVKADDVNYAYAKDQPLWALPLSFELYSGDRIHIKGNNGSGKTTLVQIITGKLQPTDGTIQSVDFSYVYLDQEYTQVNSDLTVLALAEQHNVGNLEDHEVKSRLSRALFPADTWDKTCRALSGGEKMRLYLCCLMLENNVPDMFILDEPTNNLDLSSLNILTQTIKNYRGSLLVISHDQHFIQEIGTNKEIMLTPVQSIIKPRIF